MFLQDVRAQQLSGCLSTENGHLWVSLWQGREGGENAPMQLHALIPAAWDAQRTKDALVTAELGAVGQEHVTRDVREHLSAAKVALRVHALLGSFGRAVKEERLLFKQQLLCYPKEAKDAKDTKDTKDNKKSMSITSASTSTSPPKLDELLDQALEMNRTISSAKTSTPPTWAPLLPLLITLLNKLCEVRVQAHKCLHAAESGLHLQGSVQDNCSTAQGYKAAYKDNKGSQTSHAMWAALKTLTHALK